jgi:RES domain-containing protein
MTVFRLCKAAFRNDLSGQGARLSGARWNSIGVPMLYTAGTRALSVLEYVVNFGADVLPKNLYLLTIEVPDSAAIERPASLPRDWKQLPAPESAHRFGDTFVRTAKALVLVVPSVVIPEEENYLINPIHPEAGKITILRADPFSLDPRLFVKSAPTAS